MWPLSNVEVALMRLGVFLILWLIGKVQKIYLNPYKENSNECAIVLKSDIEVLVEGNSLSSRVCSVEIIPCVKVICVSSSKLHE